MKIVVGEKYDHTDPKNSVLLSSIEIYPDTDGHILIEQIDARGSKT